jgi:hypothetical protein
VSSGGGRLRVMTFTLYTRDGTLQFSGDAHYRHKDNGVLVVTDDGRQTTYSPCAWFSIEESEPRHLVGGF